MIKKIQRYARLLPLIMIAAMLPAVAAGQPGPAKEKLVYFFSPSCNRCQEVKAGVLATIERDYQDRVEIESRDIADIENYKLLLAMREMIDPAARIEVPVVFYQGRIFSGKIKIEKALLPYVRGLSAPAPSIRGELPAVDLMKRFLAFTPVTVVSAGLIDGINPCAFTVIVFFMSFLALQGYRRRELALIGSSFIIAVFLTYLLLGLGLFNFFYSLQGLWIVRKALNIGIGLFTLALGMWAVRDIVRFKKTGSTEAMALQLPGAVKDQIHKIIGLSFRRPSQAPGAAAKKHFLAVVITTLATGFLVSLLEAVCTGQVYLPTITFVLKTTPAKLQAAWYLVLYNVMFIVPLVAIFLCALAGVTSGQFTRVLRGKFILIKSLLAGMFFLFGILLIWRG
jgi:hypothetical protein